MARPRAPNRKLKSMSKVEFEIVSLGNNRHIINDQGRTVALISRQAYLDWVLRSPSDKGPLYKTIVKDTHFGYTLGLKMHLAPLTIQTSKGYENIQLTGVTLVKEAPDRLRIVAESGSANFSNVTTAVLTTDSTGDRYEWHCETVITNTSDVGQELTAMEYQNIMPGMAGKCFLYGDKKEYRWTLITGADGTVWQFQHQHNMHYGRKLEPIRYATGTMGGFFGQPGGSPVITIDYADLEPHWSICDMYYDLHVLARPKGKVVAAGESMRFVYRVQYLSDSDSEKIVATSKPIPVTEADYAAFSAPRVELGLNRFTDPVGIDREDYCSQFRLNLPVKAWDREVGCSAKGSLRITNDKPQNTVWVCEPPSAIPAGHTLRIRAKVRTQGVTGKGAFVFVGLFQWQWEPKAVCIDLNHIASSPISGTSDWTEVVLDPLVVPHDIFDAEAIIGVSLDGEGVAWITDLDLDLKPNA